MAGLRRLSLNCLNVDVSNSMIVGVIIAKSGPRLFKSKKKEDETRGVWSFTLRDSDIDFINCTVWGSGYFVSSFDDMFKVGDVVDVLSPRIKTRDIGEKNEQFIPHVTSPFHLVLNEGQSEMTIHEGDDFFQFLPLLHIPSKSPSSFITLADVQRHAQDIKEDNVELLVAVRSVAPVRVIKSKTGDEIMHREVNVMDQTVTQPFKIMLWDTDSIKRAESWNPRETILFISDMRLEWSDYSNCIIGRVTGRTVLTEDPQTIEAKTLKDFARNAPIQAVAVLNQVSHNIPDPNSIRNVMTVQQVLDRANGAHDYPQFTALIYALVTHLDLDGTNKLILYQCGSCSNILRHELSPCGNLDCSSIEMQKATASFDIRVTLTDHTGSISNCRLTGTFAEKILGCRVDQFLKMDVDSKGQLKWNLLLERCATRIVVMKGPLISILSCTKGDPNEIVNKLPVY